MCVCDGSSNGPFPVSLSLGLPICCDISVEIRPVNNLTVASKWPLSVQVKGRVGCLSTLNQKLEMIKLSKEDILKAKTR